MGKKANPAVIGAFVVGAIALAVTGLLVFGSGRLFRHTAKFICFFPGAVDGLNVGAPVKFKGVEIGSVTDIRLRLGDTRAVERSDVSKGVRIPVFIEIDPEKTQGKRNVGDPKQVKELIDLGLRAQLNAQSLVTGLLFVQLDFRPDTPATLVLPPGSVPTEIPTIPTQLEQFKSAAEQILRKLEDAHLENLVKSASDTVDGINRIVSAPGLTQAVAALPATVTNVNQTVTSLRELAVRLDNSQGLFFQSLDRTSNKTAVTLEQARATLQTVQGLIDPGSPLASQLTASLREVAGAARSLRLLADYLERNPSAIVRGRDVNAK
jgi:paraquat-inducible protein B